jgi:pimeloyl-ACP methyl ester carboxylesterase
MALHLSPNSGQVFASLLPLLGADRLAIAPDYPGYGMSDPIAGEQRIGDYAGAMLDVADDLGIEGPLDLIGYHTGAAVALEMARQRPERVGRILLVAVPVLTDAERAAGAALPPIPFDTDGDFAREEWRRSWKWRGPGQDEASVFATFGEKMRPGVRERGARAILAYDVAPVLAAADHRLMIVRVNDDLWVASARAREIRPDAKYLELADYGHGLFDAAPAMMADVARGFFDAE